eukprot:607829-Prorocentrum_minimum.AAC.1
MSILAGQSGGGAGAVGGAVGGGASGAAGGGRAPPPNSGADPLTNPLHPPLTTLQIQVPTPSPPAKSRCRPPHQPWFLNWKDGNVH